MGGGPAFRYWISLCTCLKMAFAEFEDIEIFHGSNCEHGNKSAVCSLKLQGDRSNKEFLAFLHSNHMKKLKDLASFLDITSKDVTEIFFRCPQLLRQSMEIEIAPFVEYICGCLDIGKPVFGRILLAYPSVMTRCVQQNAVLVINFLREFNLNQVQLKNVIIRRPQLLALRVDQNLRPTVTLSTLHQQINNNESRKTK